MAPAAANYYSPPAHVTPKQRGYRICDTCGAIENPSIQKFRYCGGCVSHLRDTIAYHPYLTTLCTDDDTILRTLLIMPSSAPVLTLPHSLPSVRNRTGPLTRQFASTRLRRFQGQSKP